MSKQKILLLSLAFACVILSGCSTTPAVNPCDVEMNSHSAVTPAPRDHDWWIPRHEKVLARIKEGNANLIFIGDSITHGWEGSGKDIWAEYYAPHGAVNMGFGGDRTQHVLWRLDNGEIDGINPKLAVIMIGTNNSNGTDNTAEEIADGIKAIVCKLRTDLPETKVLILSIFPRGDKEQRADKNADAAYNPQWEKNDKASELASKMADNKMIYYLDINDAFLDENGTLTREIMPDLLHPKEKGYKLWAEAMEPTIEKLMK
ncbi:MAG: platelet-activating factor acetylhydrolase IB subunit [Sedimentisphaeraceae bacterium JB056]